MLFQTWEFAIFFAVVLGGLLVLRRELKAAWLTLCSYYFYADMSPALLVFIIYITLVDYVIGRGLAAGSSAKIRKLLITLSVLNGIMLLSLFKYADFITVNLQSLCNMVNWNVHVPTIAESTRNLCLAFGIDYEFPAAFLLPAGLSFFTFKSLSYTIDVYRNQLKVERSLWRYAAYLAFFPALLSGPIDRAGLLLRQIRHKTVIRYQDIADGVCLFIVGLFKKVVLADTLAVYVNSVFGNGDSQLSAVTVLFATYAFAWQLYGDFSGYTDMARGIARIMGFHLTLNFNNPYVAVDVSDFWRRWHISLSTWFRDYVYIPLGGNRVMPWRLSFNLFLTMLVSGFWHGSAWTFIIWGAWHGLLCIVWRLFEKAEWYLKLPKLLKQIVLFNMVCLGWIFFCAGSLSIAWNMVKMLFTNWSGAGVAFGMIPWYMLALPLGVWIYQLVFDSRFGRVLNISAVRYALMILVILLILLVPSDANQKFLYFDF